MLTYEALVLTSHDSSCLARFVLLGKEASSREALQPGCTSLSKERP